MEMTSRALAVAALLLAPQVFAQAPAPAPSAPADSPPSPDAGTSAPPSSSAPSPATPPSPDISSQLREASERYQRALKSYDEGNFDAALVEFRRAYELAPTFRILYNLGVVSLELRDYASALDYFERYLVEGAASISPEQRSEVEQKIRDLSTHVAHVTVVVDLPGSEIAVDDRPVGVSPLAAPLRINAGARKISARASGRVPDVRVIELAGGDSTRVELNLVSPRAASEVTPPPSAEAPSRPVPWLAWGGTAVLTGAAVIVGLQAVAADNDYDDQFETPGTSRQSLDDADAKATRLSVAADVLGLGALALGGYALYLTIRPSESAPHSAALELGFTPGGARLRGSF
jgi:hypothetical protein